MYDSIHTHSVYRGHIYSLKQPVIFRSPKLPRQLREVQCYQIYYNKYPINTPGHQVFIGWVGGAPKLPGQLREVQSLSPTARTLQRSRGDNVG